MDFSFNVYIPLNTNIGDVVGIHLKGQNSQATNTESDAWNTFIGEYKWAIKQDDLGKTIRKSLSIRKNYNYQSFDTALADTESITIRQKNAVQGFVYSKIKLETSSAATPWSPNPADPEYYAQGISIPYTGTVPCNQLEQGFTVQFTATSSSSSLSFKIGDAELTYGGAVAIGDVFMFSGFSYTQNGLSIVSKTNKAYFILHPDKPNRITCNVPGTVRILGFQNLYA